ncbi:hypothetical protein GW17_00003913 [Ensete ventricosum]|nr:hypothetical protein GW17_00003913 [Ensete ventricosum]
MATNTPSSVYKPLHEYQIPRVSNSPHLCELCTTLSVVEQHIYFARSHLLPNATLALSTVKFGCERLATRFAISTCTARYGRYIPVRQVTDTWTARYRAVPSKIDCRRSISAVGSRLRKKKGRKRGKGKKKEEGKKEYLAIAVLARGSPAHRRRPRPLFLPREETRPAGGDRGRFLSRARRQIEATIGLCNHWYSSVEIHHNEGNIKIEKPKEVFPIDVPQRG